MTKTTRLLLSTAGLALAVSGTAMAFPQTNKKAAQAKPMVCPVTKSPIGSMGKPISLQVNDTKVNFCCAGCPSQFKADPAKYVTTLKDPVTHKPFHVSPKSPKVEKGGALYVFSTPKTQAEFNAHPEKYTKKS